MQNLYPLFERNRILKKELLWSLRDYSFAHIQLEYQEYGEGIIKGCDLEVREKELVVGTGIVKYGGFIYLITEEMSIPYEPTEQLEVLKMKMEIDKRSEDYIGYGITLFLDHDLVKKENELEICRFKLRKGSRLRNRYKDFSDLVTEFDTVNVIEADWGGLSGKTLSPVVTRYFSELVLREEGSSAEDISFAYQCLNLSGAVRKQILEHYIESRLMKRTSGEWWEKVENGREECLGNMELFDGMVRILGGIRSNNNENIGLKKKKRQIVVE